QTFTIAASDPVGFSNVQGFNILINSRFSGANACWLYFQPSSATQGTLYLANDNASSWTPVSIGSSATLSNSQCSFAANSVTVSSSQNTVNLRLPLAFMSGFSGAKNIYLRMMSKSGSDTGYQTGGTWTVNSTGGNPDFSLSVTPGSGS